MKLAITQHDRTVTYELDGDEQSISEMLEVFEQMLKALGYIFDGTLTLEEIE